MSAAPENPAPQAAPRPVKAVPKHRKRPQKSVPFDADELTQRLYVVLAEQRLQYERRRQARAEAEKLTKQPAETKGNKRSSKNPGRASAPTQRIPAKPVAEPDQSERHRNQGAKPSHEKPNQRPQGQAPVKGISGSRGKAAEDGSSAAYHHVPQVAASQFSRTTTTEGGQGMSLVHKLSKRAMQFHMSGPNSGRGMAAMTSGTAPSEQTKALRRAQSQRERQYERNQFQHPAILEAAAEVDEKQAWQAQRQTFETHFQSRAGAAGEDLAATRLSAGSPLGRGDLMRDSLDMPGGMVPIERLNSNGDVELVCRSEDHRVDWTQSDELATQPRPSSSQLQKLESKLTLRARLGSFSKHGRDEGAASPPPQVAAQEEHALKSARSSFFARFKR